MPWPRPEVPRLAAEAARGNVLVLMVVNAAQAEAAYSMAVRSTHCLGTASSS